MKTIQTLNSPIAATCSSENKPKIHVQNHLKTVELELKSQFHLKLQVTSLFETVLRF